MTARFTAAAAARVERLAAVAVADAADGLAGRIVAEAPGIDAIAAADGVRLSAPGLTARVFGSRRRGPDLRLAAILGGGR